MSLNKYVLLRFEHDNEWKENKVKMHDILFDIELKKRKSNENEINSENKREKIDCEEINADEISDHENYVNILGQLTSLIMIMNQLIIFLK